MSAPQRGRYFLALIAGLASRLGGSRWLATFPVAVYVGFSRLVMAAVDRAGGLVLPSGFRAHDEVW
jgi:hypothetical protein